MARKKTLIFIVLSLSTIQAGTGGSGGDSVADEDAHFIVVRRSTVSPVWVSGRSERIYSRISLRMYTGTKIFWGRTRDQSARTKVHLKKQHPISTTDRTYCRNGVTLERVTSSTLWVSPLNTIFIHATFTPSDPQCSLHALTLVNAPGSYLQLHGRRPALRS
jgi:hypothetical protein